MFTTAKSSKVTVTKGVVFTDDKGKKQVLTKEEFIAKMKSLAAKSKAKSDFEKGMKDNER